MPKEIILASGSPRRRELLELIGIPFRVMKSEAPETVTKREPEEIVKELALRKAEEVAARVEEGILLGADTIVWADGRMLGKPADRADAREMLQLLQGKAHQVYTGVALLKKEAGNAPIWRDVFCCETVVHVHAMSAAEIEAYLDTGDPFDKAGSYGIQGPFAAYVDAIEGDYQNVVGLPISAVYQHLKQLEDGDGITGSIGTGAD